MTSPGRKRPQLLDLETAEAILAEPFDEAAEADRLLPLTFTLAADGTKAPCAGVLSVFLTATTVDILACRAEPPETTRAVSKDKILGDIQFRGAIADLYADKAAIVASDLDALPFRANDTDVFGDGNNFEVAVTATAAERWAAAAAELERRKARDARIELRKLAKRSLPAGRLAIKVCLPSLRHCGRHTGSSAKHTQVWRCTTRDSP